MSKDFLKNVELAINDFKAGKVVILADSADRENEGDLIFPAETITPEIMNFIIRHSSGIVCLSLPQEKLAKLNIPLMVTDKNHMTPHKPAFTISIEARHGVTTGVSAEDRCTTIHAVMKEDATANDIILGGHMFPLQARSGGVLERPGHTEGSLDLARLAGFKAGAILCELTNDDGTMARGQQLNAFAEKHQIRVLTIEDLIDYQRYHQNLIAEEITAKLPTEQYGDFKIFAVKEKYSALEHLILLKGEIQDDMLVRIQSCCFTGDLFGSARCDCNHQLHYSLAQIAEQGGMIIYLNQEGRGIGLFNKIKAYALQDQGHDTLSANLELGFPIDMRNYAIAASFLRNHRIQQVRLLTNNPLKVAGLAQYGIQQVQRLAIPAAVNQHNVSYLKLKKEKLFHLLEGVI